MQVLQHWSDVIVLSLMADELGCEVLHAFQMLQRYLCERSYGNKFV